MVLAQTVGSSGVNRSERKTDHRQWECETTENEGKPLVSGNRKRFIVSESHRGIS